MAAVALLNANGTRKMSVKSPNQTQQGQTVTVELDISDAYGTEFLVAVYDYANNVTTYRVEMDLGAMEREYFTAIDYNTMTYVAWTGPVRPPSSPRQACRCWPEPRSMWAAMCSSSPPTTVSVSPMTKT